MTQYRLINGNGFSSYDVGNKIRNAGISSVDDKNYKGFIDLEQFRLSEDITYKERLIYDDDWPVFTEATITLLLNLGFIQEIPFEPLILKLDTKEEIIAILGLLELDQEATMEAINNCSYVDVELYDDDLYSATEDMYDIVKNHVTKL